MDEATYTQRVKRLQEVNRVIEKLDPAIREQAFKLLQPYVTEREGTVAEDNDPGEEHRLPMVDAEAFFSQFDHDKPSDNALLITAFHYGEYGPEAFSVEEVRQVAIDVGITIPERVDMTFAQATRDGKKLFKRAGTGNFKPTVHGQAYLKNEYTVKQGRKKKPQGNST